MFVKKFIEFAALLTLIQPVAAAAAPCLTAKEAGALVRFALPDVVEGVASKCRPSLPSGAFLDSGSAALVDRYRTAAVTAWPLAKPALIKLAAEKAIFLAQLPDETLKPMAGQFMGAGFSEKISTSQCPAIDRMISSLSALPAESVSDMMVAIVEIATAKPISGASKPADFSICPSPLAKAVPTSNATITSVAR
jgi:hypothetical protein